MRTFPALADQGKPLPQPTDGWSAALEESKLPLKELKNICNLPFSTQTIQRRLAEDDIRKWRAAERAKLTYENAEERLKWALQHRHWTVDMWKKVAWSDESAVKKDSDTRSLETYGESRKNGEISSQECCWKTTRWRHIADDMGMFCGQQTRSYCIH